MILCLTKESEMDKYIMPVKAIKRILKEEHKRFFESLKTIGYLAYYKYAMELAAKHIDTLETYEDIEYYMHESRRMGLTEWIESL
jgi:hypothetical protein